MVNSMDKTKYSDFTLLIIYFLFALCWAAKNLLPVSDMLICGVCGVVLGIGVILFQKIKLPEYLCRGIGVFAAAIAIVAVDRFIFPASTNAVTVIKCVFLPVASGAMFMDGVFVGPTQIGKTKAFVGSMSSLCLTIAILATISLTGIDSATVSFSVDSTAAFMQNTVFSACVCCFLALSRHIKLQRLMYIFPISFICAIPFNYLNLKGMLFTGSVIAAFMASIMVGIIHRQDKTGYLIILTPTIYCCCPGGALHKFFVAILTLDTTSILPCTLTLVYNIAGLYIGVMAGTILMNKITSKKSQEFKVAFV